MGDILNGLKNALDEWAKTPREPLPPLMIPEEKKASLKSLISGELKLDDYSKTNGDGDAC